MIQHLIYTIHLARTFFWVIFFFRELPSSALTIRDRLLGYGSMILLQIPLAWGSYFLAWAGKGAFSTLIRYLLRYAVILIYLCCLKKQTVRAAAVPDMACSLVFLCTQNLFMTPVIRDFRFGNRPFTLHHLTVSFTVEMLVLGVMFWLASRNVMIHFRSSRNGLQFLLLLLLTSVQFYIKSLYLQEYTQEHLPIIIGLHIMVYGFLLLFQKFLILEEREEELRIAALTQEYQCRSVQQREESEQQIRRIYHDMKNHLLASQALENGSESREYLENVLRELRCYEPCVETGNSFLDSFLSEKIRQCQDKGVPVQCHLDFQEGGFLSAVDLCTIFGNALDNAVEAVLSPEVPENQRGIWIKGGSCHRMLAVKFCNYSARPLKGIEKGELPRTSKPDAIRHGIGLFSVREAVRKYGGALSIHMQGEHCVVLSVMIPIPAEQQKEESSHAEGCHL